MKDFYGSFVFSVIGLGLAYWWGGVAGVGIAALLSVMEVTLSFDNAVVNAAVLRGMEEKWQKRFLTWGILIAVFGMRLLFPLVIVALATGLSIWGVGDLALENPEEYSRHVLNSHISISAFGGMFLLMVFFHYFFDDDKDLHWLRPIEARLGKLGKLESSEVIIALSLLLALMGVLPEEERYHALLAGTVGAVLYVAVSSMTALMSGDNPSAMAYGGFMGFMYLQILDASFSLDGVIGALAMSKDIVIIMLGLGIGAFFVRSMTVYMVRKGTLDEFVYLEHGAHYGIGALATIMLVSMMVPVSEVITGLVGAGFIGLSLISSIRYNREHQRK
ncbi:MAG: DUF475 domain-containing protein [Proteobacteria bacterium]|nr:DUF475 domain-containing protein [Pseudomonadota bacterium]